MVTIREQTPSVVNHAATPIKTETKTKTKKKQAKNIIIACKDDRDWIDPETGEFYIGFNTCDINMITSKKV